MRILTENDRLEHIAKCRRSDKARGCELSDDYYESLGDSASYNSNTQHCPVRGFSFIMDDAPDFVVDIAISNGWISERFSVGKAAWLDK